MLTDAVMGPAHGGQVTGCFTILSSLIPTNIAAIQGTRKNPDRHGDLALHHSEHTHVDTLTIADVPMEWPLDYFWPLFVLWALFPFSPGCARCGSTFHGLLRSFLLGLAQRTLYC